MTAKKSTLEVSAPVVTTEHEWLKSGMVNSTVLNPEFTGVARSVECFYNQGHNNFRILTIYIEKGKVVKMERSDPYAQWEALQKLELWSSGALFHLNIHWADGKTISK